MQFGVFFFNVTRKRLSELETFLHSCLVRRVAFIRILFEVMGLKSYLKSVKFLFLFSIVKLAPSIIMSLNKKIFIIISQLNYILWVLKRTVSSSQ